MSESISAPQGSIGSLLASVTQREDAEYEKLLEVATRRIAVKTCPLYLRVLIGVGATVVGALLIGMWSRNGFLSHPFPVLILGSIILAASLYLYRKTQDLEQSGLSYAITQQLSFVGVFKGKLLLVIGANDSLPYHYEELAVFLATLAFTLATYWLWDVYVDRFVSSFATIATGIIACEELMRDAYGVGTYWVAAFVHLLLPLAVWAFLSPRVNQKYHPMAIAAVCNVGWVSILGMFSTAIGPTNWLTCFRWAADITTGFVPVGFYVVSLICMFCSIVSLIWVILWGYGGENPLKNNYVRVAVVVSLALGMTGITSCVIAILVIVIGYVAHDRLISIVGMMYLPISLFTATHSLSAGLMLNGFVLIGMSGVMLAGYFALKRWCFADDAENAVGQTRIGGEV